MKRVLIALAVLSAAVCAAPAYAADMPTKAPPISVRGPSPCLPGSCTGFYVGANLTGAMTNANVIGNGINGSLAAGGQSIGIQGGYQFASGGWFFGPEISANYVVNGNSPAVAGVTPSRYRVGEYLRLGTSLSNLFSFGAAPQAPGIPSGIAASLISPYVLFGAVQSGIGQGWATGAGAEFAVTKNWFVDTRYTYINYGSANVSPTITAKTENLVTAGLNYKF